MRRRNKEDPDGFAEAWELIRRRDQKFYVGRRNKNGKCLVQIVEGNHSRALPLARNVLNHSRGFEWGYAGSGPAQLALAILCDFLGDNKRAVLLHQGFKSMIIGRLPKEGWQLADTLVKEAVEMLESTVNYGVSEESSDPGISQG